MRRPGFALLFRVLFSLQSLRPGLWPQLVPAVAGDLQSGQGRPSRIAKRLASWYESILTWSEINMAPVRPFEPILLLPKEVAEVGRRVLAGSPRHIAKRLSYQLGTLRADGRVEVERVDDAVESRSQNHAGFGLGGEKI